MHTDNSLPNELPPAHAGHWLLVGAKAPKRASGDSALETRGVVPNRSDLDGNVR
jgi:hypothetical protein